MKKKLFSLALSAILVIAMATPAFANAKPVKTISPSSLMNRLFNEEDTDHAYNFTFMQNNAPGAAVLNCHTNATIPISGTAVSLWQITNDDTQTWYLDKTNFALSETPIRPNTNRSLALNADRSSIGTVCNVITSANNIYNDYNCSIAIDVSTGSSIVTIKLPKRYNHLNEVFVTYGGVGDYCRWNYQRTESQKWYLRDGPSRQKQKE